jgi:hypothetical protein
MKIFKKIASLFQRFGSVYESTSNTFPQLDVDKLKLKLHLKEAALERGAKNLPPSDSEQFDDVELKIISYIEDEIRDGLEKYNEYLRAYEERINQLKAIGHIEHLDQIAGVTEGDLNTIVLESKFEIFTARDYVRRIEEYFEFFKKENKLNRPAFYPDSYLLNYAIILFMMLLETSFNAFFFTKGNELGWLGGISTALGPTIINFSLAYLLGDIGFRYLSHISNVKKLFGFLLSVTLPCIIISMNLGIAHWRDSMQLDIENSASTALQNFKNAPFALADIKSWIFMCIGCMFSLMATLKFWKSDDAYPHYGSVSRKRDDKVERYNEIIMDSTLSLETKRDDRLEELRESHNNVTSRYTQASTILIAKDKWNSLFINFLDHLENVGQVLISFYRSEDIGARSTPAPEYFSQKWILNRENLPVLEMDKGDALESFKYEPEVLKSRYSSCIKQINTAFDKSMKKFQSIDQL